MTEYFVICEYDNSYPPNAMLIPIDSMEEIHKVEMAKILNLSNKIQRSYEKRVNMYFPNGYKFNSKFDDTDTTKNIINYWCNLLYGVSHDHEGLFPEEWLCYYINDENQDLSPTELYDYLMELKLLHGKDIIVKKLVMISNVPFDEISITRRFFFTNQHSLSIDEIKNTIMKSGCFQNIQCAANGNNEFAGYGYVELADGVNIEKKSILKIGDDFTIYLD